MSALPVRPEYRFQAPVRRRTPQIQCSSTLRVARPTNVAQLQPKRRPTLEHAPALAYRGIRRLQKGEPPSDTINEGVAKVKSMVEDKIKGDIEKLFRVRTVPGPIVAFGETADLSGLS